ncbi:response regulator [bacterium]|nr:response regulator [bacterium]MCI0680410.1 response regulator [bacterium]
MDLPKSEERAADSKTASPDTQKKILIVEDELSFQTVLHDRLAHEGYGIFQARSGVDALRIIAEEKPDLILLDLALPGEDGIEVLREMRKREASARIPIIIISNLTESSMGKKARQYDIFDYIEKSNLSLEDVVGKVKRALEGGPKEAAPLPRTFYPS